jgi:hypothetical protein
MLSVDPGLRPQASSATLTLPSGEPPPGAEVAPIQWPSERSITHSEEPQVQSLPATALARSSLGPIVAAVIGIGALVATAALFVAVRHGSGVKPAAASIVALAPPSAVAVVTVPAPTIAPPELDESIGPSASVAPARPAAAPSSTRSKIATSAPVKRPTAAPTFAPDRPGPGF